MFVKFIKNFNNASRIDDLNNYKKFTNFLSMLFLILNDCYGIIQYLLKHDLKHTFIELFSIEPK
jgi:hypothetical protein